MNYQSTEDEILTILSRAEFGPADRESALSLVANASIDWPEIYSTAVLHDVAPLVYRNLARVGTEEVGLADAVNERFRASFAANLIRERHLRIGLWNALSFFNREKIDVLIVKGAALDLFVNGASSYTYSNDIDIILGVKQTDLAPRILEDINRLAHGFPLEFDFYRHHDLDLNGALPLDYDRIWSDAVPIHYLRRDFKLLSPEDTLICACINACRKRYFNLKAVNAIDLLLRNRNGIQWDLLAEKSRQYRCGDIVSTGLYVARELRGSPIETDIIEATASGALKPKLVKKIANRFSFSSLSKMYNGRPILNRTVNSSLLLPYLSYRSEQIWKKLGGAVIRNGKPQTGKAEGVRSNGRALDPSPPAQSAAAPERHPQVQTVDRTGTVRQQSSPESTPTDLIPPYGDVLVNLMVSPGELQETTEHANSLLSIQLSERSVCDLELLAMGGFSPLDRFMSRTDYERVLGEMRLGTGHIFPIPITLPVDSEADLALDREVALRNSQNELLATMTVEEIYPLDKQAYAQVVFGTTDPRHPLVAEMQRWGEISISGQLRVLALPKRYDFRELRMSPVETRAALSAEGRTNVVAFQTRNPLHRAHEELTRRAIEEREATLLLHPVVGMTKPGDVDHYTRVRTYKAMKARHFEPGRIVLALLPLAMRMAGPREALWHAVIRRNYGANHLIVGRDHASPGAGAQGDAFYGPYDAQELVERHSTEIGVSVVPFRELLYRPDNGDFVEESQVAPGERALRISGTSIRQDFLDNGHKPPAWVLREEVAEILADARPPKHRQGVCIWFTGLSGAGKSTTAELLTALLLERGRQVTVLDGDVVRTHLSKGLGFSKEDRDTNVRRIGFVASELVRHGGVVICAAVSPYRATRNDARNMVGSEHFVEVFMDTPLEVCEERDTKGLYAKARRGEIAGFTGIDDPYEPPERAELTLETVQASPEENAFKILDYLEGRGFARSDSWSADQETKALELLESSGD